MAKLFKTQLKEELERQTTPDEARALAQLAQRLSFAPGLRRTTAHKRQLAAAITNAEAPRPAWVPRLALALGASLLVAASAVFAAQGSMPDGDLYPLKRLSERALVALDDDHETLVLSRRLEEVRYMAGDDSQHDRLVEVLTRVSEQLKQLPADTTAEQRLDQLEEAARNSSPTNRSAIDKTIRSFGADNKPAPAAQPPSPSKPNPRPQKPTQTPDLPDPTRRPLR